MGIALAFEFEVVNCCNCGVAFALPSHLKRTLEETHRLFYCPNGHSQLYSDETEAERLKRELQAKNFELEARTRALYTAQASEARLRKRIEGGVCPCCNRTFQNVARHMATKHKGRELPAAAAQVKRLQ